MADTGLHNLAGIGVTGGTGKHTESLSPISRLALLNFQHMDSHLLECRHLAARNIVDVETTIVDELSLWSTVSNLGHPDVAAILVLEEHNGGPVVGLILLETAGCALGELSRVLGWVHGDIEGITADDLVKMGSELHARVNQGIRSLNDQL